MINQFIINECDDLNLLKEELKEVIKLKEKGYTDIYNKELRLKKRIEGLKWKQMKQ